MNERQRRCAATVKWGIALAIGLAIALGSTATAGAALLPASVPATHTPATSADTSPSVPPPWSQTTTVGVSVQGRPITLTTFGTSSVRVLFVGGVHGNEAGTRVANAFAQYLTAHPSACPRGIEIDVLACANPDGFVLGRRWNANGVDLNRNFPGPSWRPMRGTGGASGLFPASEPETQAMIHALDRGYIRVVSLHSRRGLVDFDGRGGYTIARRIGRAAHVRVRRLGNSARYSGSMGHYVPESLRIPIVTWELSSSRFTARVLKGLLVAAK